MLVNVANTGIPLISLGTSPFIGAGQFGFKGLMWRQRLLRNPSRMASLMIEGYRLGLLGAHIIPEGAIPSAVQLARESCPDYVVIGSLMPPPSVDESLECLASLKAKIIFIHGEMTDIRRTDLILGLIDRIRDKGCMAGVATHTFPVKTLRFLIDKGIRVPILLPFNPLGCFMENKTELECLVDESNVECIAMKILAAGEVKPIDAIRYLAGHNIKAVTIGATEIEEIREIAGSMQPLVKRVEDELNFEKDSDSQP